MAERTNSPDDRKSYEAALEQLGHVNAVFPERAREQMQQMLDQMATSDGVLGRIASTAQSDAIKGGFAAEVLHSESFNLDAILQRKTVRAYADSDLQWGDFGLKGNDQVADIVIGDNGEILQKAQAKYYGTAQKTADAFRSTKDGAPSYQDADTLLGPSDQVSPADGTKSVVDHAQHTELRNLETRPSVSEAAGEVQKKVAARLEQDGVQSREVTLKEARDVGAGRAEGDEFRKSYQNEFQTRSTLQNMRFAAAGAAATTAVIVGSLNTIKSLRLVSEGKLTPAQATWDIVKNTSVRSADSALKASAATGAVSLAVKHMPQLFAGQALKTFAARTALPGATICAVDLAQCMVKVAAGKMTVAELEERTGKNFLSTSAGVWGSSIAMVMAPSGVAFAPFLCGLSGGLIAAVSMNLAIENHIEKPFRQVVESATVIASAQKVMGDTAAAFAQGQAAFEQYLLEEQRLDAAFLAAEASIDESGDKMKRAIDRL